MKTKENKTEKKFILGKVVRVSSPKTVVVEVVRSKVNPLYKKKFLLSSHLLVHDPKEEIKKADRVLISEVKPVSKLKSWKIVRKVK